MFSILLPIWSCWAAPGASLVGTTISKRGKSTSAPASPDCPYWSLTSFQPSSSTITLQYRYSWLLRVIVIASSSFSSKEISKIAASVYLCLMLIQGCNQFLKITIVRTQRIPTPCGSTSLPVRSNLQARHFITKDKGFYLQITYSDGVVLHHFNIFHSVYPYRPDCHSLIIRLIRTSC